VSKTDSFPLLPKPRLTVDEVVSYLLGLKTDGHDVYRDSTHENVFYIALDELNRIWISVNATTGTCQVQLHHCETVIQFLDVSSSIQLDTTVASFARRVLGNQWPHRPTSGRLSAATPATNFRTISQLIGSSKVEAVFDPYLENLSLETLIHIVSFGNGEVANGVRLLGSTHKTKGAVPKLTKTGVDAWLTQLGIHGEARVMIPNDQHRRFMLLSGGQSLILGHSLNAIHKNEAIHLESDAGDRVFFDSVWAVATPLT
jgi:hypothetical protein